MLSRFGDLGRGGRGFSFCGLVRGDVGKGGGGDTRLELLILF